MPSLKQRIPEELLRGMEKMIPKRPRGDVDVTPKSDIPSTSPEYFPEPKMDQWKAGQIDELVQDWVKKQTKKKGYKPSTGDIQRYRDRFTQRYKAQLPDVQPTPEVRDRDITPETRIKI